MREEHEEAIERLKKVKDRELEAVANAHDTARLLTNTA